MYVCASHKELDLRKFNRLYSFPNIPVLDDHNRIILDSGAFGLSKSGRAMDDEYIASLASHYKQYAKQDNVFCIAPDVFKNPALSMRQYEHFRSAHNVNVVPVLQFHSKNIDLFSAKKQIHYYSQYSRGMICISNNKFDPVKQKKELIYLVVEIKKLFSLIHVLGAGYSHNNVKDWLRLGVNSIDSISYYTDAQAGIAWVRDSYKTEASSLTFKDLAIYNASVANEILY